MRFHADSSHFLFFGSICVRKVDFVFKKIFGSEENKDVLLSFLNDSLRETEQQPLTHIILVNPYLDKTMVKYKLPY
ncbi:PD-(D/E)XK nuclease family transposase [Shimazuella kribbensis]|uniref:PD-(D/E)XK nuclease family transposase n=1 Tax=Shimazuella kribbensis TaxID=139808 RepID=UPI00316ABC9A